VKAIRSFLFLEVFTQERFKIKKTKLQDGQSSEGPNALMVCPSCNYKQSASNSECEACGIIFGKYTRYTPVKAITKRFLSPAEITEIRELQKHFTKIKHDTSSKTELILRCQKDELLDLAAYYVKNENDKKGIDLIKKITSLSYNKDYNNSAKTSSFVKELFSAPFVLTATILLLLLAGFSFFVSSYLR
jgi:hypothetical protein